MEHLISILRQPLTSGGFIEVISEGEQARTEIHCGYKSEMELREISQACLEAADQLAADKENTPCQNV